MFLYYTLITVITLFTQLAMLIIFRLDNLLPKESKKYFTLAFITFTISTFLEWFSDYILIFNVYTFNYVLIQAIMHIFIPLTPYYLGLAFKKYENEKTLKKMLYINVLIQALSLTPYFVNNFRNIFEHGNTYVIYFSIFIFILYKMFINVYQASKLYQSRNIWLLVINIFLITNFAIVLQSQSNGINTIFITNTTNAVILYGYYSSLINKRDGLTSLLNRRCFENRINSLKRDSIFLFIDLNKFKEINDTHGHVVGDLILKEIATVCLETFIQYGNVYRIGGDEYCVILRKRLNDVDILIDSLHKNIALKRANNPLIPSVSVGYGYFINNTNTVDDAINEADAMMYELKNKHSVAEFKL